MFIFTSVYNLYTYTFCTNEVSWYFTYQKKNKLHTIILILDVLIRRSFYVIVLLQHLVLILY